MKGEFVEPQEIAPQVEGGCDYSKKGVVLVRFGKTKLVWRQGGGVWNGNGMPKRYMPCSLQIINTVVDGRPWDGTKYIFEGGRLALYRIAPEIKKIRELMGLPSLDTPNINLKRTYIVTEA